MITENEYLSLWRFKPDVNPIIKENSVKLLKAVNALMVTADSEGVVFPINPVTQSQISGDQFGGFRPMSCPVGAAGSAHKQGMAVDIFDPKGEIDAWCVENVEKGGLLERFGIYIEHPAHTDKWSHWTIRRPQSGKRVFIP